MSTINWAQSFENALKDIRGTDRLLFLFFHHPECGGCRKTMSTTFTDPEVMECINSNYSSVSLLVTEDQELTARFNVEWTPTFIIADEKGHELERWVGYLPPRDFIAQIYLAEGLAEFHMNRFSEAGAAFEWIIDNHPDAEVAPEARYYMGVAMYKESGDPEHLERTWEAMHKRYPARDWTKKASAWS
ncbi:MAG: thioredoxin fold domain-containing protein [Thermodesulfobacteriota bacterium]